MFKILFAVIALGLSFSIAKQTSPTVDGKIATSEYSHTYKHLPSGIILYWQIVGDSIFFGIQSPAKGWTGIGFNPVGNMKGSSDMYMFLFTDGKLVANDMTMIKATGAPKFDKAVGGTDDIVAAAGTLNGKGMVIEFTRAIDTKDKMDRPIFVNKWNKVLFAVGDKPNVTSPHKRAAHWEVQLELKR